MLDRVKDAEGEMTELGDDFRLMKSIGKKRRQRNRTAASRSFQMAKQLATATGLSLVRLAEPQYQLRYNDWLWNLYPGNQRIYVDDAHRKTTPFLNIKARPWGLIDVVKAAISAKDQK